MTTATRKSVTEKDIKWTCDVIDRDDIHIVCRPDCTDLEFAVGGDLKTLKKLRRLWGGQMGFYPERVGDPDWNKDARGKPKRYWGYPLDPAEAVKTLSALSKSKHLSEALQAAIDEALDEWTVRNVRGGGSMYFVQPWTVSEPEAA
jgi:hypothetical protein